MIDLSFLLTSVIFFPLSLVTNWGLYLVATYLIPQWYLSEYFEDKYRRELDDNPEYCSKENKQCECYGTIFYGSKLSEGNLDMTKSYNQMEAQGVVECGNTIFEDPQPGARKYCFC